MLRLAVAVAHSGNIHNDRNVTHQKLNFWRVFLRFI